MPGRIYPTVAETIETHRLLIEEFGGSHGLQDRGLLEAATMRPQSGYYGSVIEAAAALMESLANNHAFLDGNKRISFVMTDALLRANGYFMDVEASEAHKFITGSIEKRELRFDVIHDWLMTYAKPL